MVRSVSIGTTRKALISSAYQCKDLRRPSDRGSLPWSTPPRSPSQTSPSSRRKHKLRGARAVCEVMRGSSGAARGDCARPGQRPLTGRPRRCRGLGRGRLTEPIAAARPCRSELVFMPRSRRSVSTPRISHDAPKETLPARSGNGAGGCCGTRDNLPVPKSSARSPRPPRLAGILQRRASRHG